MNHKPKLCAFLILFCLSFLSLSAQTHYEIKPLLERLDSLIKQMPAFEMQRNANINSIRNQLATAKTPDEIYFVQNTLFKQYHGFNADSATYYLQKNEELAQSTENSVHYLETLIQKASLAASTGSLEEAIDLLSYLYYKSIPDELKYEFYNQIIFLHGHLQQTAKEESLKSYYGKKKIQYIDSIMTMLPEKNDEYYINQGWIALEDGNTEETISALENSVRKHEESQVYSTAMIYYMLGRLYERQGNQEKYGLYMALAAIVDIQNANKDQAALEELASWLYEKGERVRGYNYMNFCVDCADSYHNRVRIISTHEKLDDMRLNFLERAHKQDKNILVFTWCVTILLILLLITLALLGWQFKKQRKEHKETELSHQMLDTKTIELTKANEELQKMNEKLTDLNQKFQALNNHLKETNLIKEEYIGYAFTLCSNYIDMITSNRKMIGRKLIAGQYDDIRKMAESNLVEQTLLKQFYKQFDSIFLTIYPDFVKGINEMLKPEEQIQLKQENELTTEIRIYALIRLGITDTNRIADFLRCNPHTIYNYRMKMRNKSFVSKEVFFNYIRNFETYVPS